MKIGIDIDDVVAHFVLEIVDFYNQIHGTSVEYESMCSWDLKQHLPLIDKSDRMKALINYYTQTGGFYNAREVTGAVDAIHQLQQAGHELFFISARNSRGISDTYRWFEDRGLPLSNLYFDTDKGWHAERLRLDYHIDDGIHNLEDICDKSPHTRVILFDRPWNHTVDNPDVLGIDWDRFYRVESWNNILEVIEDG